MAETDDDPAGATPVLVEGTAGVAGGPPGTDRSQVPTVVVAESRLDSGGEAPERTIVALPFSVVLDDGSQVEVRPRREVRVGPTETIKGPWREVKQHRSRPASSTELHGDGHVVLTAGVVAVGDRVCVIGSAGEVRFVADTGGPREAPARAPASIDADVIATGDGARAVAEELVRELRRERERAAEREREAAAKQARAAARGNRVMTLTSYLLLAGMVVVVLAGVGLLVAAGFMVASRELVWRQIGAWLLTFTIAVVWRVAPTRAFPGGAAGSTWGANQMLWALATGLMLLVSGGLPVSTAFSDMNRVFALFSYGLLVVIDAAAVVALVAGMVGRPRARPGPQVLLPASAIVRAALGLGLGAMTCLVVVETARLW